MSATPTHHPEFHGITAEELSRDLLDARSRTLELVEDLDDLMGPRLEIINPLLWEMGHVAWFQEHWVMRHLQGKDLSRDDADALYDSMKVAHDTRWDLPLPDRAETLKYMETVLDRVQECLHDPVDPRLAYYVRLATFHEDMHDEAFTYTRQTLSYTAPRLTVPGGEGDETVERDRKSGTDSVTGDVLIPGGTFALGATPDEPYVFDNEKWGHTVGVDPFLIARAPVTCGEFLEFVEDRGYAREELWGAAGWTWRQNVRADHPVYWRKSDSGSWEIREFDQWVSLSTRLPVIHVNWYEAQAYCRWVGRRLPTEAEWEAAAAGIPVGDGSLLGPDKRRFPWGDTNPETAHANLDGRHLGVVETGAFAEGDSPSGLRQLFGNVWEWTSTVFGPFPGFVPDPYKDYSEPWFGDHMVLRGGAWTTRRRMLRNTWRNFYTPDRRDVLAGFRTCAGKPA